MGEDQSEKREGTDLNVSIVVFASPDEPSVSLNSLRNHVI